MRHTVLALASMVALAGSAHAQVVDGVFASWPSSAWAATYVDPGDSAFVSSFSGFFDSSSVDCSAKATSCLAAGPTSLLTFNQSIATIDSTKYVVQFDLNRLSTSAPSTIDVTFGGATAYSNSDTPSDWIHVMSGPLLATTGGSTLLEFKLNSAPGFYILTNVSVSVAPAVPEPQTYAMMLAGLGALGWLARRRAAS